MFNVGDKVLICKPANGRKNREDEPTWVQSMDKYDGTEAYISHIRHGGKWIKMLGQPWVYGSSWLSYVSGDDEFEAEDLSCLI